MQGNVLNSYSVKFYNWDGTSGVALPQRYRAFEAEYAAFVAANYLGVDESTRAFLDQIIAENGLATGTSTSIDKILNYIKKTYIFFSMMKTKFKVIYFLLLKP
jgi:hypothetical protein